MKKKFCMVIVLAMLAMLTGCGNEKNENIGTSKNQIDPTVETTDEREMEELTEIGQ